MLLQHKEFTPFKTITGHIIIIQLNTKKEKGLRGQLKTEVFTKIRKEVYNVIAVQHFKSKDIVTRLPVICATLYTQLVVMEFFLFIYLFGVTQQIVYSPQYPCIDFTAAAFLLSSPTILLKSLQRPYIAINSSNLILVHLAFACYILSS